MGRFTGGSLWGNVRIVASGLPYRVGLCHCLDCREHHGALFHASALLQKLPSNVPRVISTISAMIGTATATTAISR